jgi:coproporphyrinogen III oxidase
MLKTFLPVKDVSVYNTPPYITIINLKVISTVSQRSRQHQAGRDGCITVFNLLAPEFYI